VVRKDWSAGSEHGSGDGIEARDDSGAPLPVAATAKPLAVFVRRLRQANILHTVEAKGGYVIVHVNVSGERWEVEFFPNAPVEVEIFKSTGQIEGEAALITLFQRFSDTRNT
jgi:hypothetical protein